MKKIISVFIILFVIIGSMGCAKEITNGQEVNGKELTETQLTETQLTETQDIETNQSTEEKTETILIDDNKKNNTLNDNKTEIEEEKEPVKESEISLQQQTCDGNVNYLLYVNDRFGFSIQYPEFLCNGEESFNGDGITLTSESGEVELAVWGAHNVLEETIESLYNEEINKHPNAAYKVIRDDFFVVSWVEGDKIFYENTVVSEDVINTFVIQYPVEQKEEFDPIVTEIYHNFYTTGEIGY
ncbi:hypothetical protein [Clostridium sp. DL1XJH146]